MKLGEFVIDLFVNMGSGELTVSRLATAMGELEVATVGEIGAIYQLGTKLASLTDNSIRTALGLEAYSSATGASTTELQKWQAAAQMAHVSGDTIANTFENLSDGLESMKWGEPTGFLKGAVQILGIDPTGKDVYQVMDSISAELTRRYGKDQAAKVHVLKEIGIPKEMLRVLDMTAAEREHAAEGAYSMSVKQQKTFLDMEHQMIRLQRAAVLFGASVAEWSAPAFLAGLDKAVAAVKIIQEEIKTGTGFVGRTIQLINTSVKGWGMIAKLFGGKDWGDIYKRGSTGLEDIIKRKEQSGSFEAFGKDASPVLSSALMSILASPLTPMGAAISTAKTFSNVFNFPGITEASEARRAAKKIMTDQSDDTEYLVNRGAAR